jgi:uncharacterized protein (TIGR03437 family)
MRSAACAAILIALTLPGRGAPAPVPLPPRIFFIDVEAGPVRGGPGNLGVPIAIFGKGFGASRGASRVTIGGVEVARYMVWGAGNAHNKSLDMIVVQPGARVTGGPVVVAVNGQPSNADHGFSVNSRNIYYVAPGGRDSSSCSETAPCGTILHAVTSVMKPGDTLLVRGGAYSEGEIWIRAEQGGAEGQSKVIKNYPGEEPYLQNPARDVIVDANYITVAGLNFQNGKSLAAAGWASRNQAGDRFVNNTFTGNIAWAAVDTHGSNHLVAGNVCDVSGSSVGTMGHCYYISQGSNQKIIYNVGGGQPGYGLHLYDEQRATPDFQRVIRNVLVEGNTFKNSTQRSGMIIAINDQGGYGNIIENVTIRNNVFTGNNHAGMVVQGNSRDIRIYNNTFYQNGRQAIYLASEARLQQVDLRNNLFYQSSNSACRNDCAWFPLAHVFAGEAAGNVTISGNSYHPGSPVILGRTDSRAVTGDVQFLDAPGGDFHLLSGSAPIDRGSAIAAVPTDLDGRARPQGASYDIGAFEFATRIPSLTQLLNGVTMTPGPLAPGALVTGIGWNLGPAEAVPFEMEGETASTFLAGTRALFDDIPAPLLSVAENQVTAMAPFDLSGRAEVKVEIDVDGERSNPLTMEVAATSPGIFTLDSSGQGQGFVVNEDGTLNSARNPARRSSVVVFYAAGLGLADPPCVSGRAAAGILARPVAPVSLWIGGAEAELLSAATALGMLENVLQIVARVPQAAERGDAVSVVLRAGAADSRGGVTLSIR